MLMIDYSERDRERRFKILEGVGFDLEKARELLRWVEVGDVVPVMVRLDDDDTRRAR